MPLPGCSCTSSVAATVLLALLLLPAEFFVPDLTPKLPPTALPQNTIFVPGTNTWFFLDFPPLDIFLTLVLLVWATTTYLCAWIQRKIMERRILKLRASLQDCVKRARGLEAQQEQTETSIRLARAAAAEYGLLMHLLLARRRPSSQLRC
ncbi:uncharacterized protein LOC123718507 [Pieris brassicae]|uniref:Uncharacterized protein n=1 Tax=Pieris brassicae TaxID=7116 RepID=A0A9P0XEI3_PIEBR|nr:uncharacterized protein LOC123718507 [Pieris brassicae]CAH4031965.1 unnamed protein product [Pieris brassicae]